MATSSNISFKLLHQRKQASPVELWRIEFTSHLNREVRQCSFDRPQVHNTRTAANPG